MYLDTPVSYIGDLWEKLLYNDQPAGWLTIGEKKNILKFERGHLLDYFRNHYSTLNTVVCIAGNFNRKEVEKKVKEYFRSLKKKSPKEKLKVIEKQKWPQSLVYYKETDQTHLCLGVRGYNLFQSEKYAQEILATILGGNMSSRLFISVRAEKGLCYYIRTSSEYSTDAGYLVTQAGIPHKNIGKVIDLILKEYNELKTKKLTAQELQKAKDYLKGVSVLSLESSDAQASFYSSQELLSHKILTLEEEFAKIDKVTSDDVQKVAQSIFRPEKLNLALIGPHKDKIKFQKLLKI
jgi:predicted Zn-dependent peptidase